MDGGRKEEGSKGNQGRRGSKCGSAENCKWNRGRKEERLSSNPKRRETFLQLSTLPCRSAISTKLVHHPQGFETIAIDY